MKRTRYDDKGYPACKPQEMPPTAFGNLQHDLSIEAASKLLSKTQSWCSSGAESQKNKNDLKKTLLKISSSQIQNYFSRNFAPKTDFYWYLGTAKALEELYRYEETLWILDQMIRENPVVRLAKGRCLQKMGRHEEALKIYEKMDPQKPVVQLTKGRCLAEMGRHDDALKIFNQMIQKDSKNAEAKLAKGRCLEAMGCHEEALEIFNKMDPTDANVQLTKGRCLQGMGRHPEALEIYNRMNNKDLKVSLTKGRCLEEMGHHEEALEIFYHMDPTDPQVQLAIARCLGEMGRLDQSLEMLNQMIQTAPQVQLAKAICLQKMGRYREALKIYEQMPQADPQVQLAKAICLQEMWNYEDALKILNHMSPTDPKGKLAKARWLQEMGRHREALEIYKNLDPKNLQNQLTKARCLEEMGRNLEALAIYETMDPKNIQTGLAKAICLQKMGRHHHALEIYKNMDPTDPQVMLSKGRCLEEMGHYHEAISVYDGLGSQNPQAQLAKGLCLEKMGYYDEALKIFNQMDQTSMLIQLAKARCFELMGCHEEAAVIYNDHSCANMNWLFSKANFLVFMGEFERADEIYRQFQCQSMPMLLHARCKWMELSGRGFTDIETYLKTQLDVSEVYYLYIKFVNHYGVQVEKRQALKQHYESAKAKDLLLPRTIEAYMAAMSAIGESEAVEAAYQHEVERLRQQYPDHDPFDILSSEISLCYKKFRHLDEQPPSLPMNQARSALQEHTVFQAPSKQLVICRERTALPYAFRKLNPDYFWQLVSHRLTHFAAQAHVLVYLKLTQNDLTQPPPSCDVALPDVDTLSSALALNESQQQQIALFAKALFLEACEFNLSLEALESIPLPEVFKDTDPTLFINYLVMVVCELDLSLRQDIRRFWLPASMFVEDEMTAPQYRFSKNKLSALEKATFSALDSYLSEISPSYTNTAAPVRNTGP